MTNSYTFNIVTDDYLRVINSNSIEQICITNSYPFNIINDENLRLNRPKIIEQNCATNSYTFTIVESVITNQTLQLERSNNSEQSHLSNLDLLIALLNFSEAINTNIISVMFTNEQKPEFELFYLSKSEPLCTAKVTSADAFSAVNETKFLSNSIQSNTQIQK
ncbi:16259_t:CDS:2 [Racocetra fulgida]|uniref:16259_t:CDS:1 n=1 Tax=Racocetra fulgida TaxID=60492 RepID=A0A9N8VUV9_9GLOM|nr:16259_t:CDS:2 [Racocetra fulgida]